MKEFKVHESETPEYLTVRLGMNERSLFARMLTKWGISVDVAGDIFQHILNKGVCKVYEERYPEK